jgi:VWFA-related protein
LTSGGLGVASVGQVVNTLARKHTEKRYSWEKTPCYLPGKPIAPDIDKSLQANSERLLTWSASCQEKGLSMKSRSFLRHLISALGAFTTAACFLAGSPLGFGQEQKSEPAAPAPVFRVTTRLVTVDVVAKDKHGHTVPNLTAEDFRIFEQVAQKRGQHEEKIAGFLAVNHEAIVASSQQHAVKMPAGVYSNLVTTRLTVPPTILLLDGLNTEGDSGTQARHQMVKMLASIPPDTPVAVFILGHDLVLLQSFTQDPSLLSAAAKKVMDTNLDNGGIGVDPHDDAFSLSNQTNDMFGGDDEALPGAAASNTSTQGGGPPAAAGHPDGPPGGALQSAEIRRFEKEIFAADTDMRVRETLDALRAIARHVSGYPGRKNLIWISTSFPMTIAPDATAQNNTSLSGTRNYDDMVAAATNALADAKVSVYPVNPAGLQTQSFFMATKAPATASYGTAPYAEARTLNRESQARFSDQESMTQVAEQTGGKICINNNDLGDCVKTAVEEGSTYYELSYYPDASNWHGEFHHIVVKSARPGLELSFRQGYYARAEVEPKEKDKSGNDPQLQGAACEDLLTSTSVLVVAQALPPDKPGLAKYFMSIDPRMLTFSAGDDGKRDLKMAVAICGYDRTGKALQYFQQNVDQQFAEKDYASLHGVPHVIQFAPREGTARVRLVVRDSASGQMGSLDMPYAAPASPVPAATNNVSLPPGARN